jgi:hypothetical protein
MSGDLDIRGGGVVAVDTETLRAAADGFSELAFDLDEIAELIRTGERSLGELPSAGDAAYSLQTSRLSIVAIADHARELMLSLRDAAAVYDTVELRVERAAAAAAGDSDAVARIDARLAVLDREYPAAERAATRDLIERWLTSPLDLSAQAAGGTWWLGPGFHSLAFAGVWTLHSGLGAFGPGKLPAGARLQGVARQVVAVPVTPSGPVTAPGALAQAAARIPGGGDSRIRVERYTMPDGSRQFAVYIAGTQAMTAGGREPFDMRSNVELYSGKRSASYDATVAALEHSGAKPGDVVHAFGHSQGAMVGAHLALEGGFDTQTLVSFGSPVEAAVGNGTLSVSLRHTDDVVPALAGGGHAGSVGAPGSFVAERVADPQPGVHDLRVPAHAMTAYTETARMLDASDDARMVAVRRLFDELGNAASVDVAEYATARVSPSGGGGG